MTELDNLCTLLVSAKQKEDEYKAIRVDLEEQVAEILKTTEEGTDKAETDQYKITVTNKLTRTLDYPAYLAIETDIPEGIRCVKLKPELDMKKLRAMEMVRPGFSAQFVTSRPAKPSVKVEVV